MADVREPIGRPMFDLLGNWKACYALIEEIGFEEWDKRLEAEIRLAMKEDGVRVILYYGQRMKDFTAMIEEFTPVVE